MQVDSLNDTKWDVLIAGTGLCQSLLALALSRSNKKVLHVDKNSYYGGCEAAFSLQEADEWIADSTQIYHQPAQIGKTSAEGQNDAQLSFSRAYSLALAPQLVYTQAKLIQSLVTSKAFRQLEFQAMGNWWLFSGHKSSDATNDGGFTRIPNNREDIAFSNSSIDLRSKRSIVKVLRFIVDFENQHELWDHSSEKPFSDFLSEKFKLSQSVIDLFSALALSPYANEKTSTGFALPRIARHLRSIGKLGPGFSSIIPKWGGLSEIAQVGCRAGAVGGAVYVLHNSIIRAASTANHIDITLSSGDRICTRFLVGSHLDVPDASKTPLVPKASRGVYVIGSKISHLTQSTIEGAPPAAGVVIIFPSKSLIIHDATCDESVHLILHTSDTGECPKDQSIIYASTTLTGSSGADLLDKAIDTLLQDTQHDQTHPPATVLWRMHYQLNAPASDMDLAPAPAESTPQPSPLPNAKDSDTVLSSTNNIIMFPATLSPDLVFDDAVLELVRSAWRTVLELDPAGADDHQFLVFEDREGQDEEDEDENYG